MPLNMILLNNYAKSKDNTYLLFFMENENIHIQETPSPYPVRAFFVILSRERMFGITPCNSFILPPIKLKFGTVIGMNRSYSRTNIY